MQARSQMVDAGVHLMLPGDADALAERLNSDADDWFYEVVHGDHVSGFSYIVVHDETGEAVARL